ncbi:hypothetical protein RFI_30973 [Reticulomyxa filosa]|uniref:Uncharacterized protein n=1 Tax=Reticulomyxa filosa TaxID=46433 RepID=X6LYL7_RETFI|nr:hypothetical protein RFI_30973 [Reticulomyxa filosa]|eukprot:ETO06426.1 hypothetical protein RFI_30973 [Reticulomyxa filosa]
MTANSITITVCDSHNSKNRAQVEVVVNELTTEKLIKIASEKLGLKKIIKVWEEKGDELTNASSLDSGDWVYFSDGRIAQTSHDVIHLCVLGSGAVGKSGKKLNQKQTNKQTKKKVGRIKKKSTTFIMTCCFFLDTINWHSTYTSVYSK